MIRFLLSLFLIFSLSSNILYANSDEPLKIEDILDQEEYTLEIEGLKYLDKADLAKAIGAKEEGFLWNEKFVITEDLLDNMQPSIKKFLESHGFFKYKISIKETPYKIIVNINEGKPVKVKDIRISTNFDISDVVSWERGEIFSADKFINSKQKIIDKLLENGYCKYKLDTKAYVDLKSLSAKLVYKLNKNGVCRFGKINIEHYPKDVKKRVILSRIKYREGDRFNIKKIRDSYLELNRLNTFANIKIAYDLENNDNRIETTISLDKRAKLKRYLLSLGFDSEIGLRAKGEWEKRNFLGNAQKITIKTQLSKDYQTLEALFFSPALISFNRKYVDYYLNSGFSKKSTDALDEKKIFINSYLRLEDGKWDIKTGIGIERLSIDLYDDSDAVIGGNFDLIYPYIDIIYDARDDKLDPKNGYYFRSYLEYGLSEDKGGVGYIKHLVEGRAIKSYGDLTLAAVGKVGTIHEVTGSLPASKLFLGGGVFSNRAYGKDKIGVVTSDRDFESIGGKSFLNLQLEADYKIYKQLYGALFFDSTMISEDEYDFNGDRIDTIGVGLRYKTPIGPVKVDVGVNVHNKKDYAISLMLGQSF